MTPKTMEQNFAEVLKLSHVDHLGVRAIARQLSMSRKTVKKILYGEPKPKRVEKRGSMLDAYEPEIRRLVEETPSIKAPAVLERLRAQGYTGGVTIVRERVSGLRPRARGESFLTLDFAPGSAVQVDWADFGFAIPGCPRRVSAFVMVLCHSRYLYLEFSLSQRMGTFLRCMERGLEFFGGTTTADIFDNMKTVVISRVAGVTQFNATFLEYARSRGFAVRACNPRRGNEKGRVERPIGFIRERFWPGRRFSDLLDLNTQGAEWRDRFANNRVHDLTGQVPALVFRSIEQPLLKPLREASFNTDDVESTDTTKTFRFSFDRNQYSVPPRLHNQPIIVRANDTAVAAFLGTKEIARHARRWGIGEVAELPEHRRAAAEIKPRTQSHDLPPALLGLGEIGHRYFKVFAAGSRSIDRECVRLTFLVELFGESAVASALDEVMRTGHVGGEYVEYVLRHRRHLAPARAPLRLGVPALDAIAFREPDLAVYDQLVASRLTLDPGLPPEPLHDTSSRD
jgi:transposase